MAIVCVFGASGGVGEKLCKTLTENGSTVVAFSRSYEAAEKLQDIADCFVDILADLSEESVKSALGAASNHHGPIQGVVNCVGSLLLKPVHLTSEDEWDEVMHVNLKSSFLILKQSIPFLKETAGRAVLVSSAAAQIGLANHEAIAAAKAGIEGLVRAAAATYAKSGIRINAVAPGLTQTPLTKRITSNDSSREFSLKLHPLDRLGEAQDIANAISFLLSDASSWISGHTIPVDGGLSNLK